eukprot:scaffold20989_cov108-Isochrysis_galbana.AAC.4
MLPERSPKPSWMASPPNESSPISSCIASPSGLPAKSFCPAVRPAGLEVDPPASSSRTVSHDRSTRPPSLMPVQETSLWSSIRTICPALTVALSASSWRVAEPCFT